MRRCSALGNSFGSIWRYSYDLHILSQLHGRSIVPTDLRAALIATAKKRGTEKHLAAAEPGEQRERSKDVDKAQGIAAPACAPGWSV